MVALRRVDLAFVAVAQLGVEEGGGLAARAVVGGGVVVDARRDPAEQEAGLVRPEVEVGALAVGVGGGRLAEHAGHAAPGRPFHQVPLRAGEEVLAARHRHRHRLARVPDRVARRAEAHPLVAEQLALGRLGHPGDVRSRLQPRLDFGHVIDPAHVVALPVGDPDRLAEQRPLARLQVPESDCILSHAVDHPLYIRQRPAVIQLHARLAQLAEHRSCKAEVSGSTPEAGLRQEGGLMPVALLPPPRLPVLGDHLEPERLGARDEAVAASDDQLGPVAAGS